MIKATSQSVCSGITGCQVELLGSGAELIKEYKGVTVAMYRSLRGHVELVRTQKLLDYFKTKVVMIVDEEGLVKNLPVNPMGCYFYDTNKHGNPIVGDVILGLLVGFDMDVIGLGDRDAEQWMEKMLKDFPILKRGDE